ncbi:MAG: nucleotide exchange factor GrpE [Planctomycetes bacterium]|nr:nucleotide exchange factor GrpE [Planctomycetota bacterium]
MNSNTEGRIIEINKEEKKKEHKEEIKKELKEDKEETKKEYKEEIKKELKEDKEETKKDHIKDKEKKINEKELKKNILKEFKNMSDEEKVQVVLQSQQSAYYLDALQRLQAEFDNYQKRMEREKEIYMKYASQTLLGKLLSIVDLLTKAVDSANETNNTKGIAEGIILVQKELLKIMKDDGVQQIQTENQRFDPKIHEAVSMVMNPEKQDMLILEEFETGYMLYDRLLRASKVLVNRVPEQSDAENL